MSAPAGSCKRSRADFEPEGAPAEADAATAPTEPSRSLLEELRVKVDVLDRGLWRERPTISCGGAINQNKSLGERSASF
jgi:hypothetical protein